MFYIQDSSTRQSDVYPVGRVLEVATHWHKHTQTHTDLTRRQAGAPCVRPISDPCVSAFDYFPLEPEQEESAPNAPVSLFWSLENNRAFLKF